MFTSAGAFSVLWFPAHPSASTTLNVHISQRATDFAICAALFIVASLKM